MNPWNEPEIIFGRSLVLSLMAVGAKSRNTPIRQMRRRRKKGIILNRIEGMLDMYFWSILGPHA